MICTLSLLLTHTVRGVQQDNESTGESHYPTLLVRHIRSVDPQRQANDGEQEDNGIQSSSESEEDHKVPKSFVTPDLIPYPSFPAQRAPTGPILHKWLYPGLGQFPRGARRDSNFIRFGRNLDMNGLYAMHANKNNNFIRLGRENPRRNSFIRLGRSGVFGPKIGYFPDYYSQLFGGNPYIWDFSKQRPVPADVSSATETGM